MEKDLDWWLNDGWLKGKQFEIHGDCWKTGGNLNED